MILFKEIRTILHQIQKSQGSKNALANIAGKGFNLLFSLIFVPVYISTLGHEAYGIIAFQLTIQIIFSILELGLPATVTREFALHIRSTKRDTGYLNNVIRTSETIAACVGILVFLTIGFFSSIIVTKWLVVKSLSHEVVIQSLWIMGCQVGIQFLALVYNGSLVGAGKQVLQNTIMSIGAVLRGLATVVMILLIPDVRIFLLCQLVFFVVTIVVLRMAAYQILPTTRGKLSYDVIKSMLPFASQIIINSLVLTVAAQLDRIIVSKTLPISFLGYYSIAVYLSSVIMISGSSMLTAIYPSLVHHAGFSDPEKTEKYYVARTQTLARILFPMTVFVIFFGNDVMNLWLNDPKISEATRIALPCLVLSAYFSAMNQMPISLSSAKGFMHPAIIGQLILTFIMAYPTYMLIKKFGINGAAFANLLSSGLYFLCIIPFIHHYHSIKYHILWLKTAIFNNHFNSLIIIGIMWSGCIILDISVLSRVTLGTLSLCLGLLLELRNMIPQMSIPMAQTPQGTK